MGKLAEKLEKEANELRAELENPEITEEERVVLRNLINHAEAFLTPLAALTDSLETPKPPTSRVKKGLKFMGKLIGLR